VRPDFVKVAIPARITRRLYDHLHDARPILLRPASSEVVAPPGVAVVGTDGPALLVRPDGHGAWAEAMGAEALNCWC
jgi:hypothetical protein